MHAPKVSYFVDFYMLESMSLATPEFGNRAHEKFIVDVKNTQNDLSEKFAAALFDYLFHAAMGEARHADQCADQHLPELSEVGSRSSAYRKTKYYNPFEALPVLVELFREGNWDSGYGGEKWAKICESALLYTSLPPSAFIDHVADLAHNGGAAFDKDVILDNDFNRHLAELLNDKFTAREFAKSYFYYRFLSPKVARLISRYWVLFSHTENQIDCNLEKTWIDYTPCAYGDETLNTWDFETSSRENYSCENCGASLCEDETFYDDKGYQTLCENCYDNLYPSCHNCGDKMHRSEALEFDGDQYCENCYSVCVSVCEKCEGEFLSEDGKNIHDLFLCEDCADEFNRCDDCGEYIHQDDCVTLCNKFYCPDCLEKMHLDGAVRNCPHCQHPGTLAMHTAPNTIYSLFSPWAFYCENCESLFDQPLPSLATVNYALQPSLL